jgi:hypothetical protein
MAVSCLLIVVGERGADRLGWAQENDQLASLDRFLIVRITALAKWAIRGLCVIAIPPIRIRKLNGTNASKSWLRTSVYQHAARV